METDFDVAEHATHYAGRFNGYKLCTQQDCAETLHVSDWLKPIDEPMDSTVSICDFLESQLAVKRGNFFRVYGNGQSDWQ